MAIIRERDDLSSHEAGFYFCLISLIWSMKTYIGRLGSLGKYNDMEWLENRLDFFKMINFKIFRGIHDYVNRTAASAPKSSASPKREADRNASVPRHHRRLARKGGASFTASRTAPRALDLDRIACTVDYLIIANQSQLWLDCRTKLADRYLTDRPRCGTQRVSTAP